MSLSRWWHGSLAPSHSRQRHSVSDLGGRTWSLLSRVNHSTATSLSERCCDSLAGSIPVLRCRQPTAHLFGVALRRSHARGPRRRCSSQTRQLSKCWEELGDGWHIYRRSASTLQLRSWFSLVGISSFLIGTPWSR